MSLSVIKIIGKKVLSVFGRISPTFDAKLLFYIRLHKWPNLRDPKTFNEKTTWLKLNNYNRNKLVSKCADKYSVRDYVKSKGCGKILNELYGVYNSFDEINFDELPNRFALKCVHGCAYNIIVDNKKNLNINTTRKRVQKWQKEKYGYATAELQYVNITPKIIIEKNLRNSNNEIPKDYKFYCINGKSVGCMICSDRVQGTHDFGINFFDNNWNELPLFKNELRNTKTIEKPKNWDKMIQYAEKLSEDFPFVRVDFYNDDGNIILGEMTFTPACCCNPKHSDEGDEYLGKLLEINYGM